MGQREYHLYPQGGDHTEKQTQQQEQYRTSCGRHASVVNAEKIVEQRGSVGGLLRAQQKQKQQHC
jgi:hypothetical protein